MSSCVYFKFKSQKDYQRIPFDGTGISVFELKREIITLSRLGDGNDFDLKLLNAAGDEEYDDDTTIIPRSTSVLAKRLPARMHGKGSGARYVSGKMPANAKNSYRVEQTNASAISAKTNISTGNAAAVMDKAETEQERIDAMYTLGAEQWEQTKQVMSSATPVYRAGGTKGKPQQVVPEHEPPAGYLCYRCAVKGHWIQACPTNNDPAFDNKTRVKRTTGIPKSQLTTVEKPAALVNDGLTDDTRQPSGVMINAEGEYVVARPDTAAWELYQAKTQASAALEDVAASVNKEVEERGLQCPLDKRMFVEPRKTPCCGKTYCTECLETALVNSDLVCPSCFTEGILFDDLMPDEEMAAKIKAYEEEKTAMKTATRNSGSPTVSNKKNVKQGSTPKSSPPASVVTLKASPAGTKKRSAEEELENARVPTGPAAMRNAAAPLVSAPGIDHSFVSQMNALANGQQGNINTPPLQNLTLNNMPMNMNMPPYQAGPMSMMGGFQGMMNQNMGMSMYAPPQHMMNPNMMQQQPSGVQGYPTFGMNGMNGMSGMNGMNGLNGANMMTGMYGATNDIHGGNNMYRANGMHGANGMHAGMATARHIPPAHQQQAHQNWQYHPRWNGPLQGSFPNQQFSQPSGNGDEGAYARRPINPDRHNNAKARKTRPMDFRPV